MAGGVFAYVSLRSNASGAATPGRLVPVSRGTVVSSVSASGSIASADSRDLTFATSGTVTSIKVHVGEHVGKGKLLATLDDASAQDAVDAAQAQVDAAAAADTTTPSGHSAYVQALVALRSAQRTLDATKLTAPINGTIVAINGTVGGSSGGSGQSANSGSSSGQGQNQAGQNSSSSSSNQGSSQTGSGFITIADLNQLEITGNFTEADVAKVKNGQSATVTFDAMPGTQASGKVSEIAQTASITNNVVQYQVTVKLLDPPDGLRLGATGTVQVVTARADNVLYAPTAAIRTAGGRSTVTVMQGGQPVVRVVQTGDQGDQGTVIKSGLSEGDQLVIAPTATGGTGFPNGRFPGGLGGGGGIRIGGGG